MDQNSIQCSGKLRKILSEENLNFLGEKTGFCERLRKFTPVRAIWTFVTGLGSGNVNTLADFQRLFCDLSGEPMSYKPFHDRLSCEGFPEFFHQTLLMTLTGLGEPILRGRCRYLKRFDDILAQDGSSFALPDDLAKEFPGRFTKVSPAAVEVHCTYSLYHGQATRIAIAPDKEPERPFLPKPEELKGKLLLQDRGYASYEFVAAVKTAGGDVIGRSKDKNLNPTIRKCFRGLADKKGVVGKKLKDIKLPKNNVDLLIEGKDRHGQVHLVRLVLYYVARKDLHVYLITTLDAREFPPSIVASLYRLRWQIELFFKECKSYTKLKKFRTKDRHIVEGLIWATMLAVLIRRFLLYSAFRNTGERTAPFIAAAMSWTFFRDLGKVAIQDYQGLLRTLRSILEFLRRTSVRTNLQRKDTFVILDIEALKSCA